MNQHAEGYDAIGQAYRTIPLECRTGMYGPPAPPTPWYVVALRHPLLARHMPALRSLVTGRNIVTFACCSMIVVVGFIIGAGLAQAASR